MEFVPITTSGNDHRLRPQRSSSREKPAIKTKHQPPLNRVQLGVQMRLTIGQTPSQPDAPPAARQTTPVGASHLTWCSVINVRNWPRAAGPITHVYDAARSKMAGYHGRRLP